MEVTCHLACRDPSCFFLTYICSFRYVCCSDVALKEFVEFFRGNMESLGWPHWISLICKHFPSKLGWNIVIPALMVAPEGFWVLQGLFFLCFFCFFSLIILLHEIIKGFIVIYCILKSTVTLLNSKSRLFSQKYSEGLVAFEMTWVSCAFTCVFKTWCLRVY